MIDDYLITFKFHLNPFTEIYSELLGNETKIAEATVNYYELIGMRINVTINEGANADIAYFDRVLFKVIRHACPRRALANANSTTFSCRPEYQKHWAPYWNCHASSWYFLAN